MWVLRYIGATEVPTWTLFVVPAFGLFAALCSGLAVEWLRRRSATEAREETARQDALVEQRQAVKDEWDRMAEMLDRYERRNQVLADRDADKQRQLDDKQRQIDELQRRMNTVENDCRHNEAVLVGVIERELGLDHVPDLRGFPH